MTVAKEHKVSKSKFKEKTQLQTNLRHNEEEPQNTSSHKTSGTQLTRFQQALEIMENLENHEKSLNHGKIMEFEKNKLNNHGICEII